MLLLGTRVTMGLRVSHVGLKALPSDLAWMVRKFIVTATNRRWITLCVCVCENLKKKKLNAKIRKQEKYLRSI